MEKYQYSEAEKKLLENLCIPLAVYQFIDQRVVTVAVSDGFCKAFGLTMDEAYDLMDNDMYRYTHPDDVARISEMAYRFAMEEADYDVLYRTFLEGEYHIIRSKGQHVVKDNGTRLAIITYADEGPYSDDELQFKENITQNFGKVLREQTQTHAVNYDFLTGLPNMTYFFELAEAGRAEIIKNGDKPAICFFDLTGMKLFNHKYGFSKGDALIKATSKILIDNFSTENCGRFGGDHFAVFTRQTGLEEKLEKVLEEFKNMNYGINLPVRVGVYKMIDTLVEPSIACDRAKMACDSTRNYFVSGVTYFDADMLKKEEKRQYILSTFDKAMENGWIKVFFQPIIRAANDTVSDEEALARWVDPERGIILPDDFITVLEDAKLIYKLDLYIVKRVLEKMKGQRETGLFVVPQSVNLSRSDFYSCDIVEEVRKLVDEAGVGRDKITIEITESFVGSDVYYIKDQVDRFHELGFCVWMDDYGSGASSPEVLQKIQFDTIKFDMQFMREFYNGDKSRIILSELVKMAISLGMETVVEGVETKEQMEFLKEIGCSKLQGYYYCPPISLAEILDRYAKGIQIGFENPDESEYYSIIGKANMYDLTFALESDETISSNYFSTMPMVIVEADEEFIRIRRSNQSFRDAFGYVIEKYNANSGMLVADLKSDEAKKLAKSFIQCGRDGKNVLMDVRLEDERLVHLFIRRIAINPVTGVKAFAVIAMGIAQQKGDPALSFTRVAQSLSSDYLYFFFVDLDTDNFIEYVIGNTSDSLDAERRGGDFFTQSRRDARTVLYIDDVEPFLQSFTKENIIRTIDEAGTFTLTYRLLMNDEPVYVHMKAVKIKFRGKENSIIIGVSNIDSQKKQQEAFEKVEEERLAYSRIAALSGDFVAVFTIDPVNNTYYKFAEDEKFKSIGIEEQGYNFFGYAQELGKKNVYIEDTDLFLSTFTMENVMKTCRENGIFTLNVRLMPNGNPVYVCFRAAIIQEKGGEQLLIGISNIDDQVRREMEYANNLTAARNEANLDALTGVKNKHAYIDVEERLDALIEEQTAPEFAIVVCDINNLKKINDTYGHKAGDEYIKNGCGIICSIFRHSPVYRVGGDEFAVIVQGQSYKNIDKLMDLVAQKNEENLKKNEVVIAVGMARYKNEKSVAGVFEKADALMYDNKDYLKSRM